MTDDTPSMDPQAEPTPTISLVQDSSSDRMYPPTASLASTVTPVPNTRVLRARTMTTSTTTKMIIPSPLLSSITPVMQQASDARDDSAVTVAVTDVDDNNKRPDDLLDDDDKERSKEERHRKRQEEVSIIRHVLTCLATPDDLVEEDAKEVVQRVGYPMTNITQPGVNDGVANEAVAELVKTVTANGEACPEDYSKAKAMSRPCKSAFIRFFESKRIETEAANPDTKFGDILKIIQNNFSELSKEEQSAWAEKADEIKSDQSNVACIVSEESDGELEVEAVEKPFTFIEVVHQDDDVTDEEKNLCLDFVRRNCSIVAIKSPPLSNDLAVSLYKDKTESFGYQSGFDRATMQHEVIVRNINADNDDVNSSDPVSKFLGGILDSIEERLGAKVISSFLNLNHGQVEETEQVYDDDDDDDENNPNAGELIQSKAVGNKSWHSDKIKSTYSGRAFVHILQHGKQGAILLRPKDIGLKFKINISSGSVVFMSRDILGFRSGNPHFPRFEHKHFNQGPSISWVMELEGIETTESDKCSAIEAAARKQDAEHLDLDGIWGDEKWEPAHFKGSNSKQFNLKPRVYSIIADEKCRPLLLCHRIQKLSKGYIRDGHTLSDILCCHKTMINERALKANMHTGGIVVAKLRIFPLEFFDEWGYTSGQLKALFEADIEAKDLLVDLLAEKSKRSDSQQVSVSQLDNDGNLIKGPSLYDSLRQAKHNKDKNKVTLPRNVPNIGNSAERQSVSIEIIHAGTIATEGEGLWIPKFTKGKNAKENGGVRVCFTGVIKSHSDVIREARGGRKKGKTTSSKRRRSESNSDSDSDY